MYRILVINTGSTSTKIALFEDDRCCYSRNITHDVEELKRFSFAKEQLFYRMQAIHDSFNRDGVELKELSAVVGRGGAIYPCESGVFEVDECLLSDTENAVGGVDHPANLGVLIAKRFANLYGVRCFTVNPPQVDEFSTVARMTGIAGVYRASHLHALNLKEIAIRHSEKIGKRYEDSNYVVCHLGGGVSVSAHRNGKMIDGNDNVGGDGPMTPNRCGSIAVSSILQYVESHSLSEAKNLCTKSGGFVDLLGTDDVRKVVESMRNGNSEAQLAWDAFVYQTEKAIGAMAQVLKGKVDGILLSGGIVHSKEFVDRIKKDCGWIAEVFAYPGEFEMEALAAGTIRVLSGKEQIKSYTGKPVWDPASVLAYRGGEEYDS